MAKHITSVVGSEIVKEYKSAAKKFSKFNSAHEGYAVLLEEVDELWDVVKLNPDKIEVQPRLTIFMADEESDKIIADLQKKKHQEMMRKEAIQVAAMALRFVIDCCSEED